MSTRNKKSKIVSKVEEKAIGDTIQTAINAFHASTLGPTLKAGDYLKSALGWVYSCVSVIADEVAGINLHLVKFSKGEQEEVDEHDALNLLYQPNNAMSRFDFINLTFQSLELTGEAPWFVSFKGNKPDSLILLRPDRLTVLPGENGELLGGYKYKIYGDGGFQEIKLEPFEVIPLKYADPNNPLRGKGPLQAAAMTYDLDNYAEKWNTQFFRNSASPAGAFKINKPISKEVRKRLEAKIKEMYEGVDNAHKTMILEGDVDFKQISLSQKDMDFINQQTYSRDKLLAIFRVPRTVIGITDDVNRANAEASDYVFANRTIKPKMRRFVEQLNEFYLPLFAGTEQMFFTFEDPSPKNIDQLIARAQTGVSTGYMTINEARELFGLDGIEGGDELRDPMSFAPTLNFNGDAIRSVKKPQELSLYHKQLMGVRNNKAKPARLLRKSIESGVEQIVLSYLKNKAVKKKITIKSADKFINDLPFEQLKDFKYAFQEKQLKLADQFEAKMKDKMAKIFADQKALVLAGLDRGDKIKLDFEKENERFDKIMGPMFLEMMRAEAKLAFQLLGIQKSLDITDKAHDRGFVQNLTDYFNSRTFDITPGITRDTNDKLRQVFSDAADQGLGIGAIKTNVRELFDNMAGYRAERIARTEIIRGSNFATEEAYKSSGVVEAKEWLAEKDERTDDECLELDGQVIDLGSKEKFSAGGESVSFPPLHVNCRCTLIPVVGTPLKEGQWRPTMNEVQAESFVKDSAIKKTLYHGTTQKAADNIGKNGFNLSNRNIGEGVYLASDKKAADQYAGDAVRFFGSEPTTLKIKVNAKNVRSFADGKSFWEAVQAKYGDINDTYATEFVKQYDAITIRSLGFTVVPNPQNVVVLRK